MSGQARRDLPAQGRPREDPASPAGGRPPIGRGEHARARVLRAALAILASEGLPALTMEAVARRAGASKGTLYRRWSSRAALLVDAMSTTFVPMTPPATGELRADLLGLVRSGQKLLDHQPFARLMAAVIDAAERDASLGIHAQRAHQRWCQPFHKVLTEALPARGNCARRRHRARPRTCSSGRSSTGASVAQLAPSPTRYAEAIVDGVLVAIGPSGPGDRHPTVPMTERAARRWAGTLGEGNRHAGSAERSEPEFAQCAARSSPAPWPRRRSTPGE